MIEAMLPDMTGFELAEIAADNNVPGLLIAGHPQGQERCRALGYPHLDKPFSLSALQAAATTVLRDARRNVERLHEAYERLTAHSLEARRLMEELVGLGANLREAAWRAVNCRIRVGRQVRESRVMAVPGFRLRCWSPWKASRDPKARRSEGRWASK